VAKSEERRLRNRRGHECEPKIKHNYLFYFGQEFILVEAIVHFYYKSQKTVSLLYRSFEKAVF